jgi:hypothetical protein
MFIVDYFVIIDPKHGQKDPNRECVLLLSPPRPGPGLEMEMEMERSFFLVPCSWKRTVICVD